MSSASSMSDSKEGSRSGAPVAFPRGSRAAGRFPEGPAVYTVIGGGCFGRFYARQLLRYADRGGPVARVVVVDRNPQCLVARDIKDHRLTVAVADWADHVATLLPDAMRRVAANDPPPDRLVPSPFASHVLLESMRRAAASEAVIAVPSEAEPVLAVLCPPFARALPSGNRALSFATWICPVNCIEPPTCPAIRGPLDWEMEREVREGMSPDLAGGKVQSLHVLSCLHEAFGVGTIPMADVAREALALGRAAASAQTATTPRYAIIATVSTCHGLAGALRLDGISVASPELDIT
jgi:hypothetical protein